MRREQTIKNIMAFFIEAEKLKTTLRHSWTNDSTRQESTAEHSWMLCLIAIILFERLTIKIDQLRVLKILIVHDLAEVIIGDIPAFDSKRRKNKKEREKAGLEQIIKNLPDDTKKEIRELFEEYENKTTLEAKVAQAVDKFEAPLQHNIADINTWDQNDFTIHGRYKENYLEFDPFLKSLREELEVMTIKKVTKAKQLHRMRPEIQTYYNEIQKRKK